MIQRYSQHLNIPPPPVNRLTRGATQQQNQVRSSCVSVVSPPSSHSAPAGCRGSDSGSGDGEDAHQDGAQPRPPPPQRGERPALLSLSLSLALAVPFNFVFWADCFAVSCFWCVCAGDVESALRPGGGQQRPGSSSPNSALPCTALHFLHFTCTNRCNQNDFFSRLIRSSVFFFRRQIIAGGQRWVLPGLQAGE
jgi:hypothetical protein